MTGSLTRIRNNQVYNSDIDAATKIVPGSIVGGLWNPILTYTGNLTVGNLFVNGNTTSLDTVNIVSADPVIALNRNFSGANTYDVGFILGRGNQTNTALVWNESNKEFAFFYTSATSNDSYYGTIPNTGYANIHAYGGLFNNITSTTSTITNLITGNARITGAYLDNVVIGANVANNATFTSVITTNGISLNSNAYIFTDQTSATLFNTNATTVSFAGAATTLNMGSSSVGTLTINNPTISTSVTSGTLALFNSGLTGTLNFAGAATTINIGASTGTTRVNNTLTAVNGYQGAVTGPMNGTVGATTPNTGAFTSVVASNGLSLNSNANIYTNQTSASVFTNAQTLSIGNTSGTTTVNNALTVASTANATTSSSGALIVSGGIAVAKAVNVGGDVVIAGNLLVSGNNFTFGSNNAIYTDNIIEMHTFANLIPLTFNDNKDIGIQAHYYITSDKHAFFGFANDTQSFEYYVDGSESNGIFSGTYGTFRGGAIYLDNSTPSTTTLTGSSINKGGAGIAGALNVGGGMNLHGNAYITTNQTTATLLDATATTINAFRAATSINIGSTSAGTLTINNPTVVGSQASQDLYNTTATKLNFAGAATTLNIGAGTGLTTINNGVIIGNVADATSTVAAGTVISGGVAINKAVKVGGNIEVGSTGTFIGNVIAPWLNANTGVSTPLAKMGCLQVSASTITNWDTSNIINITTSGTNGNIVVNSGGYVSNLIVHGNISSGNQNLLVTNAGTGQVGIKKAPNLLSPFTTLEINATDCIIMPKGTTGDRPAAGYEVKGMFRFNSSLNLMEFWDGSQWNAGGATFTTIQYDQFTGNGSQLNFTMSQTSTTAGTMVMINGVVQLPVTAYTVVGTTLTFTEAPLSTDIIDARTITTTATVTEIADGTSHLTISNTSAYLSATIRNTLVWYANTSTYFNGGISAIAGNTSLTQNTLTTVDSFSKTTFRAAKYVVSVSDFAGAKYQVAEVLVTHNGTTANAMAYGLASTNGTSFVDFDASISGSNVLLKANSTSAASYCNVQQTYIVV